MITDSFILNNKSCFLLKEEKHKFEEDIFELEKILLAINSDLDINYINLKHLNDLNSGKQKIYLYTLLPYSEINKERINHKIFHLDQVQPFSRFNFLKNYLKINNFTFDIKKFRKVAYNLNENFMISDIKNRLLGYLPFKIVRYSKSHFTKNMPLLEKFSLSNFPVIIFKDMSFDGKNVGERYCSYYNKPFSFRKKFNKVYAHLSDDKSKKNYKINLFGNAENNWRNYFDHIADNLQYSDYINLDAKSVIINCGVDWGSELCLFKDAKKIYNIDPSGHRKLSSFTNEFIKKIETEQIYIEKYLYSSEELPKTVKEEYFSTTLLDVIREFKISKIDLIKSDVEGAERYMIEDLIKICEKFRPQLAISIYHTNYGKGKFKLTDLVDIPLKLIQNLKNYNFFIGHYSYERWEMILYCIPKNN